MKNKLQSINNIPFIIALAILLLNDFYLKAAYHNWLTGKLSDFFGLFVFVIFWNAIFPKREQIIYISTAILFTLWKSPYSQGFIDFFTIHVFPIDRVVDFTDLLALAALPFCYFLRPERFTKLKLNPIPLSFITLFAFCATSVPVPVQKFDQPQYLLFKSGTINFEDCEYLSECEFFQIDSLWVIKIDEIKIDKNASIDDEYHKVQILQDLDLRFLREIAEGPRSSSNLSEFLKLRDSLKVNQITHLIVKQDSITDHLQFKGTRLHGEFKRFSAENHKIIKGKYEEGIEDSIWTYYDNDEEIASKKYFKGGELIKTETFDNSRVKSINYYSSRDQIIRNKYFHLALILILKITLAYLLFRNFKSRKSNQRFHSYISKIGWSVFLPLPTLILSQFLSLLIPNSYSADFFEFLGKVFLGFLIVAPLYLGIFYILNLRAWFDMLLYIALLALGIVFVEELVYLVTLQ